MRENWRSPSLRSFFGLNSDYMEKVYEMAFLMKYHGSWSFTEFYSLPVGLRAWFLERLQKQFADEKAQHEKARRAAKR